MAPTLTELRANPDDRELRLVYGDWLASQGHPRGELIAVQDAEDHSASAEAFARARGRAIALIDRHVQLRPDLCGLADAPRRLWAQWRGGFVRRLELLVDEPGPRPGEGLRGWSRLLTQWLSHPSLALLAELVIRVDLRGEPIDETEAALALVGEGLAGWQADSGPKPPLRLILATARVPRAGARERLCATLPALTPRWISSDRTHHPPPSGTPITALDEALVRLPVGRGHYELLWFDARGHALDRHGVWAPDSGWLSIVSARMWSIAEDLAGGELARADPLPLRRIARLFERLAPRLDPRGQAWTPSPVPEPWPAALTIDEVVARMRSGWSIEPRPLAPALARFVGLRWGWVEATVEGQPWAGACGLGDDQVLVLVQAHR